MKKKELIVTVALVTAVVAIAAVLLALYYTVWRPKGNENEKSVTFEVFIEDGHENNFRITQKTEKEFLQQFMDELVEQGKFSYATDQSGMIITLNGYTALWSDGEKWFFLTDNGSNDDFHGAGDMPLQEGHTYKFELKQGM